VPLDVQAVRAQFPSLSRDELAYLDNASTTHKPRAVLDAVHDAYENRCANVHRGVHALSQAATEAYEGARDRVQRFIGAAARDEIVLTSGTTASINLVAQSYGRMRLRPGDRVLVSEMEHHSNLVPWQLVAEATGAVVDKLPITDAGAIDMAALDRALATRPAIVAVTHVSNSLGTINDVAEITRRAHAVDAVVVVDGAQAVAHRPVDVQALDCDFYAFSAHKMYGPTGVGVLYGRRAILESMPPWQGGGDMILSVSFEGTTFNELPYRLEAGTPNIAGVIGLGAAMAWLEAVGLEAASAHETALARAAEEALTALPGLRIIGTATHKAPVVSFVLDDIHPHDVGTLLDGKGVAVRTGHHCTQPVMDRFGIAATTRASFAVYNTAREVERLVEGVKHVQETFA